VINPEAAIPGAAVETDAALRRRQSISTALPSLSILDGTLGAVASLSGVGRVRVYENDTPAPDQNGVPPHSVCFVVEGGDLQAIGGMLARKKGPGCGTYGNVRVDTRDKYGTPSSVFFSRPEVVEVAAHILLHPLAGYLSTTGQTARQNVADYINKLGIGESVLLSRLYTPINDAEPNPARRTFDVLEIRIGIKGGALAPANMAVAFDGVVSCSLDDVTVQDY
jgi:uncharacterized phage protein gp47/JayE